MHATGGFGFREPPALADQHILSHLPALSYMWCMQQSLQLTILLPQRVLVHITLYNGDACVHTQCVASTPRPRKQETAGPAALKLGLRKVSSPSWLAAYLSQDPLYRIL